MLAVVLQRTIVLRASSGFFSILGQRNSYKCQANILTFLDLSETDNQFFNLTNNKCELLSSAIL